MRQGPFGGFINDHPIVGHGESTILSTGASTAIIEPTGAITGSTDLPNAEAGTITSAVVVTGSEAITSISSGIGALAISPFTGTSAILPADHSSFETAVAPTSVLDSASIVPSAATPTTATDDDDDDDGIDDIDDDPTDRFRIKRKRGLDSKCDILGAGRATTCHTLKAVVCFAILMCVFCWTASAISLYSLCTHTMDATPRSQARRPTKNVSSPDCEKSDVYPYSPDYYAPGGRADMEEKRVSQHLQELSATPPVREMETSESLHHGNAIIHEMPDSSPRRESKS